MTPNSFAQAQKPFFVLLIGVVFFIQSDLFFDQNLILRVALTNIVALFYCFAFRVVRISFVNLMLLLFLIFNLISGLWALNVSSTFQESQRVLLYLVIFVLGYKTIEKEGLPFMCQSIVVLFFLLLLYNFYLLFNHHFSIASFHSTSAHPNLLASLIYLVYPFGILSLQGYSHKSSWFIFVMFTFAISLVLQFLIFSKAALLATLLLITGLGLLKIWKNHLKRAIISLLFISLSSVVLLIVLWKVNPTLLGDSFSERLFVWEKSWQMIMNAPFVGYGAGNWIFFYTMYGIEGFDTFEYYGLIMQRPHNDFLWVTAELGVIGLVMIAFPIIYLVYKNYLNVNFKNAVVLIALLAFIPVLFFSFPKERVEHIVLLFLLLSILHTPLASKMIPIRWNLKFLLCGLLLSSIYYSGLHINSELNTKKGVASLQQSETQKALHYFDKINPLVYSHTPEGYPIATYQAQCYQQLNNKKKLLDYSLKAYQQTPFNYEVVNNLGMALNAQKRFEDAEKVLLEAHRINPRFDGILFNLAIVNYNQKEYKAAKMWIDKVNFKSKLTDYYSGLIHEKLKE